MNPSELSLELQDKLKEILADDIKVVSFDIFDTMLLRPVTNPHDVFRLVGKIAGVSNFQEKRRTAEREAKRFLDYPAEDCEIDVIYETYSWVFNCAPEECAKIMQIEMDVEWDLLYPRKSVQCIYGEVLKSGKEIIITSDMYLPKDFIEKLLEKNGYTGYSRIYLSSAEKLTKGSGHLYDLIIKDYSKLAVSPQEILHMGDNFTADIKNAQKKKLKAVYVRRTIDAVNEGKRFKTYHDLGSDNTPIKERIRVSGYRIAERFHILNPARKLYRILPRCTNASIAIRTQTDSSLDALKNGPLFKRGNNIVFIGNIHPSACEIMNYIIEALPDYNCICLTENYTSGQRNLNIAPYRIPASFSWGTAPFGTKVKLSRELKNKVRDTEALRTSSLRLRKLYPQTDRKYSEFLVCETERYFEGAFKHINPRLLILWNQHQRINYIAACVARKLGIPIVFMENSVLTGTFYLDNMGFLGEGWVARNSQKFLSLSVTPDEIKNAENLLTYLNEIGTSRYLQLQSAESFIAHIDKSKPTIFFAGDLDTDSGGYPITHKTRGFRSPIFGTSYEAIVCLAELASRNGWNLIYKPHPLSLGHGLEIGKMPKNVIFIDNGNVNINEIIDISDLVIGLLSGVIYSAMIQAKPAMTLAYMPSKGMGCTYEAYSFEDIEPTIKTALKQGYTYEQRRSFIKHIAQLNKYYLFDNLSERPIRYGQNIEEAVQFLLDAIDKKPNKHLKTIL